MRIITFALSSVAFTTILTMTVAADGQKTAGHGTEKSAIGSAVSPENQSGVDVTNERGVNVWRPVSAPAVNVNPQGSAYAPAQEHRPHSYGYGYGPVYIGGFGGGFVNSFGKHAVRTPKSYGAPAKPFDQGVAPSNKANQVVVHGPKPGMGMGPRGPHGPMMGGGYGPKPGMGMGPRGPHGPMMGGGYGPKPGMGMGPRGPHGPMMGGKSGPRMSLGGPRMAGPRMGMGPRGGGRKLGGKAR